MLRTEYYPNIVQQRQSRFCWSLSNTSPFCIVSPTATSTSLFFWLDVFGRLALPKALSRDKPAKTRTVPVHCNVVSGCRKISTEPSIVKNLRVVVITLHVSGPKYVTVRKIKFCKQMKAIKYTTYMSTDFISPLQCSVSVCGYLLPMPIGNIYLHF